MRTVSGCGSGERPGCKGTAEGATRAGVRVAAPNLCRRRTEYGSIKCTGGQRSISAVKSCSAVVLLSRNPFYPWVSVFCLPQNKKKGNVKNDNGSIGRLGKQDQQRRLERPAAVSPRRYRHRVYHPHRFVQVRKFGAGWKHLFGHFSLNGEKAGKDGMSPFQALTTAIAAQVGTGNIAGAATALYSGGPGAIFWMWLSAFFGMSTIYGEAVLAQKYKTTDDKGHVTGGPIYYIRARFRAASASSLPASSRSLSFSPSASPATWYRQTRSALPSRPRSAHR